jgi:hypothetical protein
MSIRTSHPSKITKLHLPIGLWPIHLKWLRTRIIMVFNKLALNIISSVIDYSELHNAICWYYQCGFAYQVRCECFIVSKQPIRLLLAKRRRRNGRGLELTYCESLVCAIVLAVLNIFFNSCGLTNYETPWGQIQPWILLIIYQNPTCFAWCYRW